jgi:hypothetical protein
MYEFPDPCYRRVVHSRNYKSIKAISVLKVCRCVYLSLVKTLSHLQAHTSSLSLLHPWILSHSHSHSLTYTQAHTLTLSIFSHSLFLTLSLSHYSKWVTKAKFVKKIKHINQTWHLWTLYFYFLLFSVKRLSRSSRFL